MQASIINVFVINILIFSSMITKAQTTLYTMPHEADEHEGTWIAWPHDYTYGAGNRQYSEQIWIEMTIALSENENVHIIAYNQTEKEHIEQVLQNEGVDMNKIDFHIIETDDYWMRDNGPIYVFDENDNLLLSDWGFNGWGFRAPYEKDELVPLQVSNATGIDRVDAGEMILEGGSIEVDGQGSALLCRSSITNENRNPDLTEEEVEGFLTEILGVTNFIWLDGTPNIDFTDFHIDGFARFYDESTIITLDSLDLLEMGTSPEDIETLYNAQNPGGEFYEYIQLPQTQNNVSNYWGDALGYKGSYVNFYIGNGCVLVPTYNDPNDQIALDIIQDLYPNRIVTGIDVTRIYEYGGMIHCITQQQPAALNTTSLSGIQGSSEYRLSNYPNPFTEQTTISLNTEVNQQAILRIFNSLGQEVKTIIMDHGQTEVALNASEFQSGIYFYQLEIKGKSVAKNKMIVSK